jgi:cyclase
MVTERIADNVYAFTSEHYAQVNAGVVIGTDWALLIDTLAYPDETKEIREFVEGRLGTPVRYIVNTHYHADHTLGNCWFPKAVVMAHAECRRLLAVRGPERLREAQQASHELKDVRIVLPELVFERGQMTIRVGKRTVELFSLPGHSPDGIGALVLEDHVLFAGDAMMSVPYLVDGDIEEMMASIRRIPRMKLENLIQGHGEVVLRGEVQNAVRNNLNYLTSVQKHVARAQRRRDPQEYLAQITVEACGKSRILLGGLAEDLHRRNVAALLLSMNRKGRG